MVRKVINTCKDGTARTNSIVVNVMTEMFRNMFVDKKENPEIPLF